MGQIVYRFLGPFHYLPQFQKYALILSGLHYANAQYLGSPCSTMRKLQTVQNCAARLLLQTPNRESARSSIASLHWLPVAERVQFKALCITHKALSLKGPPILRSIISPYCPSRSLRSGKKHLAADPRIYRARSGGRLFSYNASKRWNQLPNHIRLEEDYLSFRRQLKTFLFPIA